MMDEPQLLKLIGSDEKRMNRSKWMAEQAHAEMHAGFPTLHAHTLLGLCGAMECLVEDIFMAMVQSHPDLLQDAKFNKIRVPVSLLSEADNTAKFRAVVTEVTRATNSDIAVGATKYERLLKLVGLDGPIPDAVKLSLFRSQQIRNVWAHRGGIADYKFVDNCPDLGFKVGEKVNMTSRAFLPLMHGMHMYAVIIENRDRDRRDLPRLTMECNGYRGCLSSIPPKSRPAVQQESTATAADKEVPDGL